MLRNELVLDTHPSTVMLIVSPVGSASSRTTP